jgi:hypothetical protein
VAGTASVVGLLGVAVPSAAAHGYATRARAIQGVLLNSFEARMVTDMNRARANHGLGSLTVVPGATDVARRWSWQLARMNLLEHNPNLVSQLEQNGSHNWMDIEENVGFGPLSSPDVLFHAYMHSPEHRANILAPDVDYVGVGVVEKAGYAWNVDDFVDQYSSSYGLTRVPPDGIRQDSTSPHTTTTLASASHLDQRFGVKRHGIHASHVHFTRGTAHAKFHGHDKQGYGAILFRDAVSLKHVKSLQAHLGAAAHKAVHVAIKIGNGWHAQTLRTVRVTRNMHKFSVKVPHADRKHENTIEFKVSCHHLAAAGHHVKLSVAKLTAVVKHHHHHHHHH